MKGRWSVWVWPRNARSRVVSRGVAVFPFVRTCVREWGTATPLVFPARLVEGSVFVDFPVFSQVCGWGR